MTPRPDVNKLFKLPTFASLLNQKILIQANSSDYFGVDQYFLKECLRPLIDRIALDQQWYLKRYPDVKQAILKSAVKSVREHYARFGFFEHRLPYHIQVEEDWYLGQYPDVEQAIGRREFQSGQEHFERNGFGEGRIPHANFELAMI